MRARNIKPGFFKNEYLAELPMETRMLFIGLWLLADREGRLEDRPKRIKAELFAFENLDIDSMLNQLQSCSFLVRYDVGGKKFIQVENFVKHQDPHYKEKKSEIPPIPGREDFIKATGVTRSTKQRILERDNYRCQVCGSTDGLCIDHIVPASRGGDSSDDNLQVLCISCNTKKGNKLAGEEKGCKKSKHDSDSVLVRSNVDPTLNQRNRSLPSDSLIPDSLIPDSLIPDSLIPDSLIPDSLIPDSGLLDNKSGSRPDGAKKKTPAKTPAVYSQDFEAFWEAYPARNGQKTKKAKAWDAFWKITTTTSVTPEHLTDRIKALAHQYGDFPRDAVTWLNQRGWEDEVVPVKLRPSTGSKVDRAIANGQEWLAMQEIHQ